MASNARHWGISLSRTRLEGAGGRGGGEHTRRTLRGLLPGTAVPPPTRDRGHPPVTVAARPHGAAFEIESALDAGVMGGGEGRALIMGADDRHGHVGLAQWEGDTREGGDGGGLWAAW